MRREKKVTIGPEGERDAGKTYLLREMPASQSEAWGARALGAAVKGGLNVPEDAAALGLLGFAIFVAQGILSCDFDVVKPLLDEMFQCVTFISSEGVERALIEDDIEEPLTRIRLRDEVIQLHVGFSIAAEVSKAAAKAREVRDTFLSMKTSLSESQPSSLPD